MSLENVLHSHHGTSNLLSVNKLYFVNNVLVEFDPYGFYLKDLHSKEVKLQGQSDHGLYRVNIAISNEIEHVMLYASLEWWHYGLGHPSFLVVCSALKKYGISHSNNTTYTHDNSLFYKVCQLAKFNKLPFPFIHTRVYTPFMLLYKDLWTIPKDMNTNDMYCFSIMDNPSHFIWCFVLQTKSQVTIFLQV